MELIFIGPVLLPITPESIEIAKPGANSTTRLINDGEINIRHDRGLQSYTFNVLLPSSQSYPFQIYSLAGMEATAFTTYFDELQKRKIPFPFIQVSWGAGLASNIVGLLNIAYSYSLCTIEEQTVKRDAENGLDYVVSLNLKEYKDYGTKYVGDVKEDKDGKITYKVTSQTSSYSYIAELNKLASEITAKLGAIGATAASAFKMASDTVSDPIGQAESAYNKSKEFLGW